MEAEEKLSIDAKTFWRAHPFGLHYATKEDIEPGGKAFFERIRPSMTPFRFPEHSALIDRCSKNLIAKHILEVGCGLGFESVEYMKRGVRVTATDLTPDAVRLARMLFEHVGVQPEDVRVEDVLDLSFSDNYFDAVVATGVVHYTPDPHLAMAEIHRVLKPNGLAIISGFYRRPSWLRILSRIARENIELSEAEAPILHCLTDKEILDLFAGFNIVEKSREHIRTAPIRSNRNRIKAAVYEYVFAPLYNVLPSVLVQGLAAKLSIVAQKCPGIV